MVVKGKEIKINVNMRTKIYDSILSAISNIERDTWRTAKRIVTKLRNNGRGARTMNGRKGKDRRWDGEEAECREDEEGRAGKREGELKGPRYASVGVGPDWTRVSTFLRRSEQEMQGTRGKGIHAERKQIESEATNGKRGKR